MENKEKRQHVELYHDVLKNKELSTNDIGVYLMIGKYMNNDNKQAFPSQSTLMADTGLALQTVRSCIKHLEKANAFKIIKSGRKNIYQFAEKEEKKNFEEFDYEFLNKKDLSLSEKGFIAKLQPHMFKNGPDGVVKYTYNELQDEIGLSVSTIIRTNKLLEKKNYATIQVDKKIYHLDKMGQIIIAKLEEHDEEIDKLKERCSQLEEQLNKLQQNKNIIL